MLSLVGREAGPGSEVNADVSSCVPTAQPMLVEDLDREVYGVFGIPIDALDLKTAAARIRQAVSAGAPFLLSTPNLNFLSVSQKDVEFREALLVSDLCTADGTPLVWLSRIVGAPIRSRLAGSDIFDELKADREGGRPIKVFLFGGADGLAQQVAIRINAQSKSMVCVGAISPGFGSVEDMSNDSFIKEINASGADFLVASLSARKGQEWLVRNHDRLTVPIRSHLGATLNYQAGTVRRAPAVLQTLGLEWLWRIKEEPYLWRRYLRDGIVLLRVILFRAVPLMLHRALKSENAPHFAVKRIASGASVTVQIIGAAISENAAKAIPVLTDAVCGETDIVLDLSRASTIDPRFFGLLIMLRKVLRQRGRCLRVIASPHLQVLFRLNNFAYLLGSA